MCRRSRYRSGAVERTTRPMGQRSRWKEGGGAGGVRERSEGQQGLAGARTPPGEGREGGSPGGEMSSSPDEKSPALYRWVGGRAEGRDGGGGGRGGETKRELCFRTRGAGREKRKDRDEGGWNRGGG